MKRPFEAALVGSAGLTLVVATALTELPDEKRIDEVLAGRG